ncbi:energy-coupling factor transporter ATPase [Macrococcus hajekii]|uniref:Energy-coupling factor transporter ATP-binding protein EcfA2 n=1 Tax=Macrococcus hajekii TaxID=198482 RepID=A0A4R6BJE0_9STAP|nr:energy-coupling factor transporter ATPase [Macrococcus hajekii]TDM01815.1 energy-coupling factor transporter ATPase [Macrococcus hajekii]GGB07675.1 energy-coupling factor transporter ATP-binding protein EcfA2 [Macrococcus hajekii]
MINFQHAGFAYSKGTPFEVRALYDITTTLELGAYYAVIGHTGSGKSTLIQHLNGLLKPTEGSIQFDDLIVSTKTKNKHLAPLRRRVGIVFQFAEQQLFEETVLKDIIFGPLNYGVPHVEAEARAYKLMDLLQLDPSLLDRSPFDLSGGQMRRVAIAGVLAMEPEILVLDEPTAGLDPRGQQEIMQLFDTIHQETGMTIILVTHQMDQAATADRITVLHEGTIVEEGTPEVIFSLDLSPYNLMPPKVVQLQRAVEEKHAIQFPRLALTMEDFTAMYQDWRADHA